MATEIIAGNLPTSTISDADYLLITEGLAPKRILYSDVKKDILGTETLTQTGKTPIGAINEQEQDIVGINASLLDNTNDIANLSNPNLLINPNFQVWQRGTSFNTSGIYTTDRWMIGGSILTVNKISTGGVSITTSLTNNYFGQILENSNIGGSFVLSSKIKAPLNANFKLGIFDVTTQTIIKQLSCIGTGVSKIYSDSISITKNSSNSLLIVPLWQMDAGTYEIEWVKLELGSKATPFVPRLYGEELALCQRYAVTGDIIGLQIIYGPSVLFFTVPITGNLRTLPSIINSQNLKVFNSSYNVAQTGFTFAVSSIMQNSVTIMATKNSHGITQGYLSIPSTSGFDAEIY